MNLASLKEDVSRNGPGSRGGRRLVQQTDAMRPHARHTNPVMRTAQLKPTSGKSTCSMSGNTIPPALDPATEMLDAVARRRTKYVCVELTHG
jgi:hypothetical protein